MSVKLTAHPPVFGDEVRPVDLTVGHEVSATITVEDPEAYRQFLFGSNLVTLTQRISLDPRRRVVHGWRARVRRRRAIVRWDWRRLIRRPLASEMVVTVPDVPAGSIRIEGLGRCSSCRGFGLDVGRWLLWRGSRVVGAGSHAAMAGEAAREPGGLSVRPALCGPCGGTGRR